MQTIIASSTREAQSAPANRQPTRTVNDQATAFIERILQARQMPPGWLLQAGFRAYLEYEYWLDRIRGNLSTSPATATATLADQSQELMRVHYDLPLPLFSAMLGPSMKYSMALWAPGVATLEQAQQAMLADVCRKAGVRDGESILDLGCGFGSLAEYLLEAFPNVRVTGLTLSKTQADYIRRAQCQPGHSLCTSRFQLIEGDFNEVEFPQKFDRILSLGVFEHISNLALALAKVRRFLSDDGALFLHYIVYLPPRQKQRVVRQADFIQRYVFPGGRIYALEELSNHQLDFSLAAQWYLPGHNYHKTLGCWRKNFLRQRRAIAREANLDERTLRIWEIYLRVCAATFASANGRAFGNGQYLLHPK